MDSYFKRQQFNKLCEQVSLELGVPVEIVKRCVKLHNKEISNQLIKCQSVSIPKFGVIENLINPYLADKIFRRKKIVDVSLKLRASFELRAPEVYEDMVKKNLFIPIITEKKVKSKVEIPESGLRLD